MDVDEITKIAKKELAEEAFREAVEKKKTEIRLSNTFWMRVFPYKLLFVRRT